MFVEGFTSNKSYFLDNSITSNLTALDHMTVHSLFPCFFQFFGLNNCHPIVPGWNWMEFCPNNHISLKTMLAKFHKIIIIIFWNIKVLLRGNHYGILVISEITNQKESFSTEYFMPIKNYVQGITLKAVNLVVMKLMEG